MIEKQINIIHIAAAFDENFITPFYVLLTSVFSNNKRSIFVIHAITTGVDETEQRKIAVFVKGNNSEILFYKVDKDYIGTFAVIPSYWNITIATYYKLFFPLLVPKHITKLLYIDTDIVVIADLLELYNTDIYGYPIAAVPDTQISYNSSLNIHNPGDYFNAGVMLINVEKWNELKVSERAIQFIKDFPDKIVVVEQDALNVALINNWLKIDSRFNLMHADIPELLPKRRFKQFLHNKVIIHYTTFNKPWLAISDNKLRFLYHNYLKQSPVSDKSKYIDFEWKTSYLKQFIKVRSKELYYSFPLIVMSWRKLKLLVSGGKYKPVV